MKLISKKITQLKMKSGEGRYGTDRISLLPDSIIYHILSLLPTEDAVKASTLSTRWRHVWKYVPVINICDEEYPSPWTGQFTRFADSVLAHHSVYCLQKFTLNICYSQFSLDRVTKWINDALMRDIETLDLNVCDDVESNLGYLVVLPLNLITYKKLGNLRRGNLKLKNLVLSYDIKLNFSPSIYLPSLKTVCLYEIPTLDDDTVKNLIAGCPALEELEIDRHEDCINTLFIKSPSLKKLRVSTFDRDRDIAYIFDAKNLEEINLSIEVAPQIVGISLTSIVWARLAFRCIELEDLNKNSHATLMNLRKVSNVKHLYLNDDFLDVLGCCSNLDDLLIFPNLTHLEVHFVCCRRPILSALLQCAPCLISVVIDHGELICDVTKSHHGFQTPKCTMVCLESIEFKEVGGHVDEMAMIRYFLMNSPVLKKISILHNLRSPDEISKVREQIFMFPKVSSNSEIDFKGC